MRGKIEGGSKIDRKKYLESKTEEGQDLEHQVGAVLLEVIDLGHVLSQGWREDLLWRAVLELGHVKCPVACRTGERIQTQEVAGTKGGFSRTL
jgi:hypothetical protein